VRFNLTAAYFHGLDRADRLSVCTVFALWFAVRAGRFVRGRERFVQIIVRSAKPSMLYSALRLLT